MLKAYASYFVSYIIANSKNISNINSIILFGSVAKGEATKESDLDMFIDLKKESKKINLEFQNILEDFYKSREALIFRAKGIENKINLVIGKIEDWKNLKNSIEATGIVLYGRYITSKVKGKKYVVIFWDKIEKNRGAFLNKVYGFKVKSKAYKGLVEKLNGKRLGKSNIMIPIEYREDIMHLIKKHKVNAKLIEVYA
jgi:predicted nucleotidyltransferase